MGDWMQAACDGRAMVERGVVTEAAADGKFRVASDSRPGIVTPPLDAFSGAYAVGDGVIFALFDDGTGRVLCGRDGGMDVATRAEAAAFLGIELN